MNTVMHPKALLARVAQARTPALPLWRPAAAPAQRPDAARPTLTRSEVSTLFARELYGRCAA